MVGFLEADQYVVEAFELPGVMAQDLGDRVTGGRDVRVTEHDEGLVPGQRHELELGVQHRDQRAFTADQRLRQVEPLLR